MAEREKFEKWAKTAMGAYTEGTLKRPNLWSYEAEFNADGTEKHIVCEGARFHVLSYSTSGVHCSEPNCEVNRTALEKARVR